MLAHLEDLVARGAVATDGAPSIDGASIAWPRLTLAVLRRRLFGAGWSRRVLRLGALADAVVDVFEQAADARGIGAEIVRP